MSTKNDMRHFINLLESKELPEQQELNEGPMDAIKNGMTNVKAAFGNKKAQGSIERRNLAKTFKDAWENWLGRTGSKGTEQELMDFLISRAGFSKSDTAKILDINSGDLLGNNRSQQGSNNGSSQQGSGERQEPTLGNGSSNQSSSSTQTPSSTSSTSSSGSGSQSGTATQGQQQSSSAQAAPQGQQASSTATQGSASQQNSGAQSSGGTGAYQKFMDGILKHATEENLRNARAQSEVSASLDGLTKVVNSVPANKLHDVEQTIQTALDYLERIPSSSAYHASPQFSHATLMNIQNRIRREESNAQGSQSGSNNATSGSNNASGGSSTAQPTYRRGSSQARTATTPSIGNYSVNHDSTDEISPMNTRTAPDGSRHTRRWINPMDHATSPQTVNGQQTRTRNRNNSREPYTQGPVTSNPSRINNNNESRIFEDNILLNKVLSKDAINKILDAAAAYAFKNNLIGNKEYARDNGYDTGDSGSNNGGGSYNGGGGGSGGNNSGGQQNSQPRMSTSDNSLRTKVTDILSTHGGLSATDFDSLRATISRVDRYDDVSRDEVQPLSRVGWAFLRSLGNR